MLNTGRQVLSQLLIQVGAKIQLKNVQQKTVRSKFPYFPARYYNDKTKYEMDGACITGIT
jgi:hypothetical protein